MYTNSNLTEEINQVLSALKDEKVWQANWIVQTIMQNHDDISGDDADFYLCLTRDMVHNKVRNKLSSMIVKPESEVDPQLILPGFERLQKRYDVRINNETVFIRVQDMTDQQLDDKAKELQAMGDGCYQHADEIQRYKSDRSEVSAA